MPSRDEITGFLDVYLDARAIDDYAYNGLQIEGCEEVGKIGFAVDFCMESALKAVESGCQMLICHHGMIWRNQLPITGSVKKRVKAMLDNDVSLYAAHLPLDIHPEAGNNAGIAAMIPNFTAEGGFGVIKGRPVGIAGRLSVPEKLSSLQRTIDEMLMTRSVLIAPDKEKTVRTIGIISGSAASSLKEAEDMGIDLFITGETSHACYHEAMEGGTAMLCAGHYATETTGLRLLRTILSDKYEIETEFFDIPTGI